MLISLTTQKKNVNRYSSRIIFLRDISIITNLIAGMSAALASSSSSRNHLSALSPNFNYSTTSTNILIRFVKLDYSI